MQNSNLDFQVGVCKRRLDWALLWWWTWIGYAIATVHQLIYFYHYP